MDRSILKYFQSKKGGILQMDGNISYVPLNWDSYPSVNKIISGIIDKWTNAKRKRAIVKLRSIIRKHKQKI